jgi:hypothetical protein
MKNVRGGGRRGNHRWRAPASSRRGAAAAELPPVGGVRGHVRRAGRRRARCGHARPGAGELQPREPWRPGPVVAAHDTGGRGLWRLRAGESRPWCTRRHGRAEAAAGSRRPEGHGGPAVARGEAGRGARGGLPGPVVAAAAAGGRRESRGREDRG